MNYEKLGFKCGLELHVQLDTQCKLFCNCPTTLSKDFPIIIQRKLRPVLSELGTEDIVAKHEASKKITYYYHSNQETSCLLEMDEQPAGPLNPEALEITLQVAKAFKSDIVGEIQVMRKQVLDGSAVSGFQRTSEIAYGGKLNTSKGPVGIQTLLLEEDAATPIEKKPGEVHYRLDRLGIPLIEIATDPDIKDPEHLKETARYIGMLLRATGRVKRGIGTIRQDINISIKGGTRVEIKGAQDLKIFPKIAELEVRRQEGLVALQKELKKRRAVVGEEVIDVSPYFKNSKCKLLNGKKVFAIKLEGFKGLLGRELGLRRVGSELSDYAKVAGVGGIIHSDEDMKKYNIAELKDVQKRLKASSPDAVVLVTGTEHQCHLALNRVIRRAKALSHFVPPEVRKAHPDGSTSYMRPLPGASRMYVETDVPAVIVDKKLLLKITPPESPEATLRRFKKLGLNEELAEAILASRKRPLFEKIFAKHKKDSILIATTIENTLTALHREGKDVPDVEVEKLFALYFAGKVSKDGFLDLLRSGDVKKAAGKVKSVSEKEVRAVVKKLVKQLGGGHNPFPKVMGDAMKALPGADGNLVAKIVKEEL